MTATLPRTGIHHDALLYGDDAQFTRGVADFVREGLRAGELPVVAEPPRQIDLLRAELGVAAPAVRFLDMTEIGVNPARIIAVWQGLLDECTDRGIRLRGVGEPAWVGRRADELVECRIHEQLLNVAFADGVDWQLLCPYDRRGLPAATLSGAWHTHPCVIDDDLHLRTDEYLGTAVAEVFSGPLSPLPGSADRVTFGEGDVANVRCTVRRFAAQSRLGGARTDDLVLAADELATNSVRHGGGSGSLAMWIDGDVVALEFADRGVIDNPLVGRLRPALHSSGGRGIFLVNQVCDLVQIRSGEHGTTVRAAMRH